MDTGKKSVDETVSDIIALARNPEVLSLFSKLALRTLTPEDVASLANRRAKIPGVNYAQRLEEIINIECGETSIFTPADVHAQCLKDPGLVNALVNHYDKLQDTSVPLRLRLIVEGESKQIYKVETSLTRYFDNQMLVFLKPTIYSHSKQATAEITGLSAIRAAGSRLFFEMLHRAGIDHTYMGLNAHGLIWTRGTEITQIETVYKELCSATDKHSFFGMINDSNITLATGQYKRGPYVRFDWRNPNHIYNGVDPATHPFYHLMEASVGKNAFYKDYLTARAKPFGDKCVPEELVHGVQAVDTSVDWTTRIFFTIQHYLHQIGLEVQDGCIMLDPTGRTMWSEINQDCMRIKRREVTGPNGTNGQDAFDKDVWRAGGSSVQEAILDKWNQLNSLLRAYLKDRPFHEHEMVTPAEPYGLHAREVLADKSLTLTPRYRDLYERLATHDRSRVRPASVNGANGLNGVNGVKGSNGSNGTVISKCIDSDCSTTRDLQVQHNGSSLRPKSEDEDASEHLLAQMQDNIWQLTAAGSPQNAHEKAKMMVRLASAHARQVGLPPAEVSSLTDKSVDVDAVLARPAIPSGSKAIGVTAKKYADKTDDFLLAGLGVKLVRSEKRCLRLSYEIVDKAKFVKAFGEGVSVYFLPTRPKDMPGLLQRGLLDGAVTYSTVMDNLPSVARLVTSAPDKEISLALISRRGEKIDPKKWTADKPVRIVAEHVRMVRTYLDGLGIPSDTYEIHRVLGSSESYLVNDPREMYLLCDAIVETGNTLKANDLDIWQVVKNKGDIVVGFYQ